MRPGTFDMLPPLQYPPRWNGPSTLSARADRFAATPVRVGSGGVCARPPRLLRHIREVDITLIGLVCLLVLVLAGCGSAETTQTPAQVHIQWVQGVRENDRAAIEAVAGVTLAPYLDKILSDMQVQLRSPLLGALQSMDIRAPQDADAGRSGWSVWQFEHKQQCYATTLAAIDGNWKVTDWQRHPCQEMPEP